MKTNQELAHEVFEGKWGNGAERRERLTSAGYDYTAVQTIVNALAKDGYTPQPAPEPEEPAGPSNPLRVEYDPEKYNGLEVTILI